MLAKKIISNGVCDGVLYKLPPGNLERTLYAEVAKLLEGAGGKWDRSKAGFIFKQDCKPLIDRLVSGDKVNIKKEFQAFYTPEPLANKMAELLYINDEGKHKILEPSAGVGNLIKACHKVNRYCNYVAVEIDPLAHSELEKLPNKPMQLLSDFMNKDLSFGVEFDRIIMNPPFTKDQYIDHVLKAASFLKEKGVLVACVPTSFTFKMNKQTKKFRDWIEVNGVYVSEPFKDSFKESGTSIAVILLQYKRI